MNADRPEPRVVKGDQDFTLDRETFRKRWLERAYDPAFESVSSELERVIDVAWNVYVPRLAIQAAGGDPGPDPHS